MDPQRRAFLFGRAHTPSVAASGGERSAELLRAVWLAERCLAQQGVECRICGENCEAAALTFRPQRGGVSLPSLNTEVCTGCGDCLAPCPTQAIRLETMKETHA